MVSGLNALIGLLVGTAFGISIAFLLRRFRLLDDLMTPLAIALNAVPIFVLVAVFNNMFSITSEVPRRLMVTLVVYFIVLVNVARGLAGGPSDPARADALLRGERPVEVLRKVRVPNAMPYLFTALKIAAPAAVITAFVVGVLRRLAERAGEPDRREHRDRRRTQRRGPTSSVPACWA